MVAVVVRSGNGRAVQFEFSGSLCLVKVGKRASVRRVKKALRPFGDGYILSEDFDPLFCSHLSGFDCSALLESLLFNLSLKAVSVGGFGKVGVVCTDILTPFRAVELMRFVSELILVSASVDEEFLCDCISRYGACPDIGTIDELYSCDAALSVGGLSNFDGMLFGKGGVTVCGDGLLDRGVLSKISGFNVDYLKLFCLLSAEKGDDLSALLPIAVCVNDKKTTCRAFLNSIKKDFVVNSFDLV
jgi:hypothetical protein